MQEGYSQRPLIEKLGIKPESIVYFHNSPRDIKTLLTYPSPIFHEEAILNRPIDVGLIFVVWNKELDTLFLQMKKHLRPSGMLWVCWPKQGSTLPTDLKETRIRESGLAAGLVDVKVAAIDTTWSGLKFVFRLKDR